MLQYLENKFGVQALNGRPNELNNLIEQVKDLESRLVSHVSEDSDASDRELNSEEDTDEDEDDDYLDDLPDL